MIKFEGATCKKKVPKGKGKIIKESTQITPYHKKLP